MTAERELSTLIDQIKGSIQYSPRTTQTVRDVIEDQRAKRLNYYDNNNKNEDISLNANMVPTMSTFTLFMSTLYELQNLYTHLNKKKKNSSIWLGGNVLQFQNKLIFYKPELSTKYLRFLDLTVSIICWEWLSFAFKEVTNFTSLALSSALPIIQSLIVFSNML